VVEESGASGVAHTSERGESEQAHTRAMAGMSHWHVGSLVPGPTRRRVVALARPTRSLVGLV
jgi:hypothetical protein